MRRLLAGKPGDIRPDEPGTDALFINGIRYANSAAKFWPVLIDEAVATFPECDSMELSASVDHELGREHLYPEIAFEKDLLRLLARDTETEMRKIMAELEVLGPPSSVHVRLLLGEEEALSGELPPDCVDAEIFGFLVAWPLEWAGLPEWMWNRELAEGEFTAEDRDRRRRYDISFELACRHMSEGLYRRSMRVSYSVSVADPDAAGAANTTAP